MIITDPSYLDDLGFHQGINEVIVITERNGVPNAAPIGIIRDQRMTVKLFLGSDTYENVLATKMFTANVTSDPLIFVDAAMSEIDLSLYERRDGVLTLKDAESWALFKCEPFRTDIIIPEIKFIKGEVLKPGVRAFNRGIACIVEAAVAATRYHALGSDLYLDQIRKLKKIVHRCGGPREREAMDKLEMYLNYEV